MREISKAFSSNESNSSLFHFALIIYQAPQSSQHHSAVCLAIDQWFSPFLTTRNPISSFVNVVELHLSKMKKTSKLGNGKHVFCYHINLLYILILGFMIYAHMQKPSLSECLSKNTRKSCVNPKTCRTPIEELR